MEYQYIWGEMTPTSNDFVEALYNIIIYNIVLFILFIQ